MTPSMAFEASCPGEEEDAEAVASSARFVGEALALEEAEDEVEVEVEVEEDVEDEVDVVELRGEVLSARLRQERLGEIRTKSSKRGFEWLCWW